MLWQANNTDSGNLFASFNVGFSVCIKQSQVGPVWTK